MFCTPLTNASRRLSSARSASGGDYIARLRRTPAEIDYFATSLPTMLIFDEDVQQRQDLLADVLAADPAHPGADRLLQQIHAAAG